MQVELDMSACAEQEVGTWLHTIVGEFATHLRGFTVHSSYVPDSNGLDFARIRVQYRPGHGLLIIGSIDKSDEEGDLGFKNYPLPLVGMPAYVAALEMIRVKYKEQGEIIVDFFRNWDAPSQACSGPDEKLLWLGIDECGRRYGAPLKLSFGGVWRREGQLLRLRQCEQKRDASEV